MAGTLNVVRGWLIFCCMLGGGVPAPGQAAPAAPQTLTAAEALVVVDRALANELRAAQDPSHPMRYVLRKSSPRLTTTREIYETKDGGVARLLETNGQPLSAAGEQKEQARLEELVNDPGRQRRREQAEEADRQRALKVLRALPLAFTYRYAGTDKTPAGKIEKFSFRPNPGFTPPDLETEVLTAMEGEIWIDAAAGRVTRLEAHLTQDVDFGWGILGRLNKGGWIAIEQAEVDGGQWRTVKFQMSMSGRVVFKTRSFDTVEEESDFRPLPVGMGYRQAIAELQAIGNRE